MYIFFPIAGLANRMRTMESIYQFVETYQLTYKIIWLQDKKGLNCSFDKIWKPLTNLVDKRSDNYYQMFFKLRRKSKSFRFLLLCLEKVNFLKVFNEYEYEKLCEFVKNESEVKRFRYCIISSYSRFMPANDHFRSELFQLQSDIEDRIVNESKGFTSHTIGVHIRRTDNVDSIQNSPLELFEKTMDRMIMEQNDTLFYLATDDESVRFKLKEKYQNRLITASGLISRSSEQGILDAVSELYLLSRCSLILGSYYSSFSEMAARIGGVENKTIKNV